MATAGFNVGVSPPKDQQTHTDTHSLKTIKEISKQREHTPRTLTLNTINLHVSLADKKTLRLFPACDIPKHGKHTTAQTLPSRPLCVIHPFS